MKNININRYIILTFLLNVLLWINFSHDIYAADVTAPSKDNIFTLNVKNIGSVDMERVNVTASVIENLDGLIAINRGYTPGVLSELCTHYLEKRLIEHLILD